MDPSAGSFDLSHEYEISSSPASQWPKVKALSVGAASASEDYSDLPPVVHRFRKLAIDSTNNTRKIAQPAKGESGGMSVPALSNGDPEVQCSLIVFDHPTATNVHLTGLPLQPVSQVIQANPQRQPSPQITPRITKSSSKENFSETVNEESCKCRIKKGRYKQHSFLLYTPEFVRLASSLQILRKIYFPFNAVFPARVCRFLAICLIFSLYSPPTQKILNPLLVADPRADISRNVDLNEHLPERIGRGKASGDSGSLPSLPGPRMIMKLNRSIRDYARDADRVANQSHWTNFPEVPKAAELWDEGRVGHDIPVELEPNKVAGSYPSVDDYLERHYLLLREDSVSQLFQTYPLF